MQKITIQDFAKNLNDEDTLEFSESKSFLTPKSQEEIADIGDSYSMSERAAFTMGSLLQYNFVCSLLKDYTIIKNETVVENSVKKG